MESELFKGAVPEGYEVSIESITKEIKERMDSALKNLDRLRLVFRAEAFCELADDIAEVMRRDAEIVEGLSRERTRLINAAMKDAEVAL
jgi:D-alanyl-D-alanine dipeptidase